MTTTNQTLPHDQHQCSLPDPVTPEPITRDEAVRFVREMVEFGQLTLRPLPDPMTVAVLRAMERR